MGFTGFGEHAVEFYDGLVVDNSSSWYYTVANPVAQRSEVVIYDLRGHGLSEKPATGYTVINPVDFGPVFADFASLDKVPVFNLLATPGITDPIVTSEAAAYCERKRAFYLVDTPSPKAQGWDANSIVGDLGQSLPLVPAAPVNVAGPVPKFRGWPPEKVTVPANS